MYKNTKIQRQDREFEKHTLDNDDRQSSVDSCGTVKSSSINHGPKSTISSESKNSSGSLTTNSTEKTSSSNKTGSSQGSAEIEAKERRFGSINLHPLPDTQNNPLSDCYRFKAQRMTTIQDSNRFNKVFLQRCDSNLPSKLSKVIIHSSTPTGENVKSNNRINKIGDFMLERTIGKGNFAVVKLATHTLINTKVAIKIMNKTLIGANNLEKVSREIEAMKRVEHPHIIKLYQVLETENKIFMVMEFAEKGEVFDHISHAHAFTEKDARELFWQVVCSIHFCHKSGVVHRDLKAENLLLNSSYQIKVADFGFCNFFENNKLLSTHCGSPQYAAPELFKGELYDGPLADVWSLGVVLYIMVCGSFPFPGESLGDIRNQVLRGLVRFPFFLSTSCEYLVRGMLQVDPAKRFRIEQIINTPWMQASNNVEKYRALMEMYNKKAIENRFQEIFHRQHPEHSDVIREQIYYSSKVKMDAALQMALQMAGFDEDDVRNSVLNRSFDRTYAAYYLLKDKVCRFFNNPVLKIYLEAAHSSILNSMPQDSVSDDSANSDNQNIDEIINTIRESNRHKFEQMNITQSNCCKKHLQTPYNCRRNSLSNVKSNQLYCNTDVKNMAKLYYWVLQTDEEYLKNNGHSSFLEDTSLVHANVRRHTVQLTEVPNELRTLANLASISPGFPIHSSQSPKIEPIDDKENKVSKIGTVFRKKQMSLDSTRTQGPSNLNQSHNNTQLMNAGYIPDVITTDPDSIISPSCSPTCVSAYSSSNKAKLSHLSEISETPTMDSDSTLENEELIMLDNSQQDIVMGSTDSTNWTVMSNLPQLNLPVNIPALVHQPVAKFTIKDPHLLAPPDFMTPYNSCFPRRSSDGAADMAPLHRSNPGVGGSYPEQSSHKYRSENVSLYDAVVKQVVPSTKENLMNEICPLEFMGLHLKRFSLPMNGSYNIQNTLINEETEFSLYVDSGILDTHRSDNLINLRRGSEDSQMSLWHRRIARSGYVDSRSTVFASAPASRGSSPYPTKSNSCCGGAVSNFLPRKKNGKYRSSDHLFVYPTENSSSRDRGFSKTYETRDANRQSPMKSSQPVLDLKELKSELQNLANITCNRDEGSNVLMSNSSVMIIPSISLSPIASDDAQIDSSQNYSNESDKNCTSFPFSRDTVRQCLNTSGACRNSSKSENSHSSGDSLFTSSDNISPYKTQMYVHWFPGFIRSTNNLPCNEYKMKTSSEQSNLNSKANCTLLSCPDPPPLPYYSPFMREEDAADLVAIERVNRKVQQTSSISNKITKKNTLPQSELQPNPNISCSNANQSVIKDPKPNIASCVNEDVQTPDLCLQESRSAMELSLLTSSRRRTMRRQLVRGFSAEENYSFSFDTDNSSMDCEADQELATIHEQMDST